jgi:ABC-2 type transport system ATP-binding protein
VTAVIETEGLGKRYSKLWALAGCTLSIPAGHVVGLVGPNGAGKSTLHRDAGADNGHDRGARRAAH